MLKIPQNRSARWSHFSFLFSHSSGRYIPVDESRIFLIVVIVQTQYFSMFFFQFNFLGKRVDHFRQRKESTQERAFFFFFYGQDVGAAAIRPQAGVPRPAAVVGDHLGVHRCTRSVEDSPKNRRGQFMVGASLWWGPVYGESQSLVGQLRWGRSCCGHIFLSFSLEYSISNFFQVFLFLSSP